MKFQEGNEFWKVRSKHGRKMLFESPDLLWEAACEYFQWCVDNPLIEIDFKGKDAERVELPRMRAFTIQGLCGYLDCDTSYFRTFKCTTGADKPDFLAIITRIEETLYNQKFTGAAAGFLNPSIIARDLGLKENTDVTSGGEKIKGLDLSNVPLDKLLDLAGYLDNREDKE